MQYTGMDFKTLPVIYIKKENKKYVNKIVTVVTFTGRKSNGRADGYVYPYV